VKNQKDERKRVLYFLGWCIENLLINNKGENTHGIFRVNPNSKVVNTIMADFSLGIEIFHDTPDLNEVDPHVFAGLIVRILSLVHEPLIAPLLWYPLVAMVTHADPSSDNQKENNNLNTMSILKMNNNNNNNNDNNNNNNEIKEKIGNVYDLHKKMNDIISEVSGELKYKVIKKLFYLFHKISGNSDNTQMNELNLASVFAPLIMEKPKLNEADEMQFRLTMRRNNLLADVKEQINVVKYLIKHYLEIFVVPEEAKISISKTKLFSLLVPPIRFQRVHEERLRKEKSIRKKNEAGEK